MNTSEGFLVIVSFLICRLDEHDIFWDKLGEQIPLFESFLIDKKGFPEYMTGNEKISGSLDP